VTEQTFMIGAHVSCSDGPCGEVARVVVDPVARAITHLAVEPRLQHQHGRLVPVSLVTTTEGEIRLRCTKAEFEKLDPARETRFLTGSDHPGYEADQVMFLPYYGLATPMRGLGMAARSVQVTGRHGPQTFSEDAVPPGEVDVQHGDQVHATDGEIGKVQGLVIDPGTHHVTHVLLQEGHLWGRKEVAIPIGAVTRADIGIQVNMSKQEVADLPSVDIDHPLG
jgi:sporulation protein YlmC with PRC-barrel domain